MLGRIIFNRIGALVVGVLAVAAGLYFVTAKGVDCGGQQMTALDTCVTTSKSGDRVERTYDEQKSQNTTVGYTTLGIGGVIFLGGVIATVRHSRKAKASKTAVAATPVA